MKLFLIIIRLLVGLPLAIRIIVSVGPIWIIAISVAVYVYYHLTK